MSFAGRHEFAFTAMITGDPMKQSFVSYSSRCLSVHSQVPMA